MTERREITLEIGEKEFTFTLTPQDVTKYFNTLTPTNKVPNHDHPFTATYVGGVETRPQNIAFLACIKY